MGDVICGKYASSLPKWPGIGNLKPKRRNITS